jgi:hypothetical protein
MMRYLVIIIAIIVSSCATHPIEFGKIQSFKVDKFDGQSMQCQAEVEVTNNRMMAVNIETGELHAFSDEIDLGTVKLLVPLKITGKSKRLYSMNFSVTITNPEAGMMSFLGRLAGKRSIYSLRGTIDARSFLFHKKISINEVLGK